MAKHTSIYACRQESDSRKEIDQEEERRHRPQQETIERPIR
jgi:hypothetical protein